MTKEELLNNHPDTIDVKSLTMQEMIYYTMKNVYLRQRFLKIWEEKYGDNEG